MQYEFYERKVIAQGELLARILDAAARLRNMEINSDEKQAILSHELRSALRLTVGFSIIYCEP